MREITSDYMSLSGRSDAQPLPKTRIEISWDHCGEDKGRGPVARSISLLSRQSLSMIPSVSKETLMVELSNNILAQGD